MCQCWLDALEVKLIVPSLCVCGHANVFDISLYRPTLKSSVMSLRPLSQQLLRENSAKWRRKEKSPRYSWVPPYNFDLWPPCVFSPHVVHLAVSSFLPPIKLASSIPPLINLKCSACLLSDSAVLQPPRRFLKMSFCLVYRRASKRKGWSWLRKKENRKNRWACSLVAVSFLSVCPV